jgi:hypothetical protein
MEGCFSTGERPRAGEATIAYTTVKASASKSRAASGDHQRGESGPNTVTYTIGSAVIQEAIDSLQRWRGSTRSGGAPPPGTGAVVSVRRCSSSKWLLFVSPNRNATYEHTEAATDQAAHQAQGG